MNKEMMSLAQPCKTCEALARAVMMDQAAHNTTPPALAAPVQEQVLGFDVVLDDALPPNTMKFVQPAPVQEPVQEPVWIQSDHLQKAQKAPFLCRVEPHKRDDFVPLYTTPPAAQRQWVGLTDEEYGAMYNTHLRNGGPIQHFTRAIEAKLKKENT
jgi:hypothetical protein